MLQDYPQFFEDFEIEEYPPDATRRDRLGYIFERMGFFVLSLVSIFRGEKLVSQCEDPEKYKEFSGNHSDFQIGDFLIEFKNWETGWWSRSPNSEDVEQINSRFHDDDSDHEKTWIAVVADIQGFSDNMLDRIEADYLIDIGYQVFDPEDKEALWSLFVKLVKAMGGSILRLVMKVGNWVREKVERIASKIREWRGGLCYRSLNFLSKKHPLNYSGYNDSNYRRDNEDPPPFLNKIRNIVSTCIRGKNLILVSVNNAPSSNHSIHNLFSKGSIESSVINNTNTGKNEDPPLFLKSTLDKIKEFIPSWVRDKYQSIRSISSSDQEKSRSSEDSESHNIRRKRESISNPREYTRIKNQYSKNNPRTGMGKITNCLVLAVVIILLFRLEEETSYGVINTELVNEVKGDKESSSTENYSNGLIVKNCEFFPNRPFS